MGAQGTNLPEAIVWVQSLSVLLLGILAAWIAFQQWRTAQRKVQIDLFDRRYEVYVAAVGVLVPIFRSGRANLDDYINFRLASEKAFMLFGEEVVLEFDEAAKAINKLAFHADIMNGGPPYSEKDIEGKSNSLLKIEKFHNNLKKLIEPYIRLDFK